CGSQGLVVMTPEILKLHWTAHTMNKESDDPRKQQSQANLTIPKRITKHNPVNQWLDNKSKQKKSPHKKRSKRPVNY
ncbi:hypothetical protein, partial [Stenotrophomonas maltophilia]|uniref:hypothetical protein n=1 Tax=Stenotrophomonas maltophilia TaxID=40324 RepID=UPI003144D58F